MFGIKLVRFLRMLGGAGPDIEDETKFSPKVRFLHAFVGSLMVVLSIFSAICAGLAWGSVFDALAVGLGVIIGWFFFSGLLQWLMGYCVDEARGHGWKRMMLTLTVAFAIAALVSWMNTVFISMLIFRAEITQRIESDYHKDRAVFERQLVNNDADEDKELTARRSNAAVAIQSASTAGNAALGKLQSEVAQLQSDYKTALAEYTREVEGKSVTGRVGDGSVAKAKAKHAADLKALLDDANRRMSDAQSRLDPTVNARIGEIKQNLAGDEASIKRTHQETKARLQHSIEELEATPRYGFFNRHQAMEKLFWEDPLATLPIQVTLFFFECGFVIVKLLLSGNPYATYWRIESAKKREQDEQSLAEIERTAQTRRVTALKEHQAYVGQMSQVNAETKQALLAELDVQIRAWQAAGFGEPEIKKAKLKWLNDHGMLKVVRA